MSQLRLIGSSILVAESNDYLDLVIVARKVGLEKFVFDDVGLGFDVNAALAEADRRTEDIDTGDITNQDILDEIAKQLSDARAHLVELEGPIAQSLIDLLALNDPGAPPIIIGSAPVDPLLSGEGA